MLAKPRGSSIRWCQKFRSPPETSYGFQNVISNEQCVRAVPPSSKGVSTSESSDGLRDFTTNRSADAARCAQRSFLIWIRQSRSGAIAAAARYPEAHAPDCRYDSVE